MLQRLIDPKVVFHLEGVNLQNTGSCGLTLPTPAPSHSVTLFVVTLAATRSTLYQSDSCGLLMPGCLRYLNPSQCITSSLPLCGEASRSTDRKQSTVAQNRTNCKTFFSFKEVPPGPQQKYESFKVYTIFWTF